MHGDEDVKGYEPQGAPESTGDMTEAMPGEMTGHGAFLRRERRAVSLQRRRELMAFAGELAERIANKVKPHEIHVLNRALQMLLDRE